VSTTFTRTPPGLAEKWRFHAVPTIWVEGPTDIYFYEPILVDIACRLEAFHGSDNATALVDALKKNDYPYAVVFDGDYRILRRFRSPHRRVVFLSRHSFENFLWEVEPLNRCCHKHARSGDRTDAVGGPFVKMTTQMQATLTEAVVLDVAARACDPAPKVLPERIDAWLAREGEPDIDPAKPAKVVLTITPAVPKEKIDSARKQVNSFLAARPLAHLLKGHLLFGILRYLFTRTSTAIRGAKSLLSDDALTQLLSDAVWQKPPSADHQRLRRKLRTIVRALQPRYRTAA
jgi:hypothetical protein